MVWVDLQDLNTSASVVQTVTTAMAARLSHQTVNSLSTGYLKWAMPTVIHIQTTVVCSSLKVLLVKAMSLFLSGQRATVYVHLTTSSPVRGQKPSLHV
ncbi:hypothetical protein TDB9533_02422 [Thalassocella blandensis]|nr:hypothetical protein TDB9533_02422 [Thalassocella blandensis]